MTIVFPKPGEALIVRSDEAEVVALLQSSVKLLADSNANGGALSTVQVSLSEGADGAKQHKHRNSAEMFYILEGVVQILSGTNIVRAEMGDVIVVPPDLPHAFRAAPVSRAEILIVIAPGVERFEYFRQITRIAQGKQAPESLRDVQELYDTYFLNNPEWEAEQKG